MLKDDNVIRVQKVTDSDIEVIHTELALADAVVVDKAVHRMDANSRGREGCVGRGAPPREALDVLHPVLARGPTADDLALIRPLALLTAKPALYVANVGEHGFEGNALLESVKAYAAKEGAPVVAISAKLEAEIADLAADEKQIFLADMGMTEPGLDRLIHATYDLLGLHTFFTTGKDEVRAWTVRKGATAPQAAGAIHTDFEKGFIRAEVIAFDDYVRLNGEAGAKEAGKMRLEGKEYVVKDGDVMHFRFNV